MMLKPLLLVAALALTGATGATPDERQEQTVVVVVGAAGTQEYAEPFAEWAELWKQACAKSNARCVTVGLDEDVNSSDRDTVQEMLAEESRQTSTAL